MEDGLGLHLGLYDPSYIKELNFSLPKKKKNMLERRCKSKRFTCSTEMSYHEVVSMLNTHIICVLLKFEACQHVGLDIAASMQHRVRLSRK